MFFDKVETVAKITGTKVIFGFWQFFGLRSPKKYKFLQFVKSGRIGGNAAIFTLF